MSNENIQTIVTYYPCRLLLKVWMSKEVRIVKKERRVIGEEVKQIETEIVDVIE